MSYEPGSKLVVLGMVIQPLIGNPFNGYINPYYWVDDHPLLYGNNGSLDPSTYVLKSLKPETLEGDIRSTQGPQYLDQHWSSSDVRHQKPWLVLF